MPKATFADFVRQNPSYRVKFDNKETRHVFDNILSDNYTISGMIHASNVGAPALDVCMREIEDFFNNSPSKEFDLEDAYTRQGLGKLVKTVLEPFGYVPDSRKTMIHRDYVKTSTVYAIKEQPRMKVLIEIVEVLPS